MLNLPNMILDPFEAVCSANAGIVCEGPESIMKDLFRVLRYAFFIYFVVLQLFHQFIRRHP